MILIYCYNFILDCYFGCAKCDKTSHNDPTKVCTECKTGLSNRSTTLPCTCNPVHYEEDSTKNCLRTPIFILNYFLFSFL